MVENFDLCIGKKFKSYSELSSFVKGFEEQNKIKLWTRDSRKINSTNLKRYTNSELKYYQLSYACIHGGGKFISKGTGVRKTSTHKMDCPMHVRFRISTDGNFLEVVKLCLEHKGHDLSEKVYDHLPQVRRLNKEEKENVIQYLELGSNTKLIQNKIFNDTNKKVLLKDLRNLKLKTDSEANDIQKAVKVLTENYNADVSILKGNDNNFKALYFSTADMRRSMKAWPEIIFIDGTYKLLNNGLTVMILLVEDSNGLSEIVGISLINNEDYDTFNWFLNIFKNENLEACRNIRCFMSDKDLLERQVLKEVFPDIPTYICLFHTLKTFKRNITIQKFDISTAEKDCCLELISKLVYSSNEEDYLGIYKEFCDTSPEAIVNYFNKNWHPIRQEWTVHSMNNGNLLNMTNNRLESINQKIKSVVPKNSTLCVFLETFFAWLHSHNEERSHKASKMILKKPITKFADGSVEKKYEDLLTSYAYKHILKELELSSITTVTATGNDLFKSKAGNLVTSSTCDCRFFKSMLLPCRHILALRKSLNETLFIEECCSERWRKAFYLKNHRATLNKLENVPISISSVDTVANTPKIMSQTQKRKVASQVTTSLVNLMCYTSNSNFQFKIDTLKKIELLWRKGYEITVDSVDECFQEKPLNVENTESDIQMNILKQDVILAKQSITVDPVSEISNVANTETGIQMEILESIPNAKLNLQDINNECVLNATEVEGVSKIRPKDNNPQSTSKDHMSKEMKQELSEIIMPHKIVKKGRTRGCEETVIGLKRGRKTNIPQIFALKNEKNKIEQIFGYILNNKQIVCQTIDKEYKIKCEDLLSAENVSDGILNDAVDLSIIKNHVDPEAFNNILSIIDMKRETGIYNCPICYNNIGCLKSIMCDSCLLWCHFKCVRLKSIPKKKTWFCNLCYLTETN